MLNISKRPSWHITLSLALLLTLVLLFNGCNDEPTEVGYSFIEDTIDLFPISSFDRTIFTGQKNLTRRLNIFNGGALLVGRADSVHAFSFVRPGAFTDTLGNIQAQEIDSAFLTIHPIRYVFGDSSGTKTFGFKAYRITRLFTNETTWDSVYPGGLPQSQYFDQSKVISQYRASIELKDSMDAIRLPLDKELVAEWLRMQADTNLAMQIYGLALIPDEDCNVVHQFSGQMLADAERNSPFFTFYITRENGDKDTTAEFSAIETSIVNAPWPEEGTLTIQGAVMYNAQLMFDVSFLPDLASIHRAQLELTIDTARSVWGNNGPDIAISADLGRDSVYYPDQTELIRNWSGYLDTLDNKYIFSNIGFALEIWNRSDKAGSLIFRHSLFSDQYHETDRIVFYGLDAADDVKPKLTLIYSTRPQLECDE